MADDLGNIRIGVDVRTNIKQATADLDKMGGSVVNNINTINRLESEVKQLNRELSRGRVSEAAYAKGMQQINHELGLFQQRAAKAAEVERRFGQAAAGGGKSLNRFNMTLQQGGYQLQDFIVQIQSGTSFFTAFSQQGSQFASIFGPQGAVIGAVIAIGSAIAAIAVGSLTAKDALKELQDQVDNTKGSFKDYTDAVGLAAMSNEELAEKFGTANTRIRSTLQLLEDLERKVAQQNLSSLLSEMTEMFSVGGAGYKGAAVGKFFDINAFFSIKAETRQNNRAAIAEFQAAQQQIAEAQTDVQKSEGLSRLLTAAQNLSELSGDINEKEKEFINGIAQALLLQEQLTNAKSSDQKVRESGAKKLQQIQTDAMMMEKEAQDELFNDRMLAQQEASARAAQLNKKRADEAEAYNRKMLGLQKAQQAVLKETTEQQEQDQNQLYTNAMLQKQNAMAADITQEKNRQKLADETHAHMMALQKAFYDDAKRQAAEVASDTYLANYKAVLAYQQYAETRMAGDKPNAPKAAKVLKNIQDTIDALREQTDQETKLLGLTGERLKEEEIFFDLLKENKSADIKLSEDKLRAIAKEISAQQKANEVVQKGIDFAKDLSDVFTDFIMNGFKDFKSFVSSIGDMFKRLLAEMVARALATNIFMPITAGFTGTMMGSAAGAATGSMIGAGAAGGGFLAGIGAGAAGLSSGFMGVMTGGGLGSSFANLGGLMSGSVGGMGAIGAAIPAIAAIAVVVGLFTKKVKQLDSGLRVTIGSTGTLVEQFNKLQTSRLFGLIKSTSTSYKEAGANVADPIIDAIGNMQQSIIDAAGTLGIGAAAFDNFSYQFKVSLKGLTEEQQLQKINEEITKMGDSFASLSGHFETMNELLAAAQQRYDIETRLLGLLNNQSALLTRQREAERAATNELNRGLLEQVYKLEDAYSAVNSAFAVVQRSIEARKTKITEDFNEIMDALQGRIEAAQSSVGVSGGIVSSLEGAAGGSGMTRGAGLAYLRSLRGASRITDQKKLDDALQAIADPSQDLYTNFVDYQRDFQDQTNLVRELEEKAKLQLSTDEQTLLQLQEEAKAAQARYDSQIEKLDEQLANAQAQLDALYGIDTSVKSVTEAISALGSAINGAMAAQKAAAEAAGVGGGTGAAATGKSFSEQYGTGSQYKGYDLAKLSGSGDLLSAAAMLGVGTTGKTGAQIQQAISNASGMAVRLDNATRSQQFAMGGMFGGGVRMVGERGPELEATGPSRIFSTKQTSELFRNPELVDEVRSLRSEVAGLRSENRQLQTSISKYSKRNYDINRKWDTDGLPATRT